MKRFLCAGQRKKKTKKKTKQFRLKICSHFCLFFCLCVSSTIEKNVVNISLQLAGYNNYTYIIPYYILLFNVSCLLLFIICVCTCVCFCPTLLIIISSVSIHFFHIFFVCFCLITQKILVAKRIRTGIIRAEGKNADH